MCFSLVRLLAESIDDSPLLLKAAIADYKEKQNVTVWDAVARFHKGCAESKQYVQYGNHTETTVSQFRCGGERHPKKKYKLNSLAPRFLSPEVLAAWNEFDSVWSICHQLDLDPIDPPCVNRGMKSPLRSASSEKIKAQPIQNPMTFNGFFRSSQCIGALVSAHCGAV
jgi:hypothetical protein